MDRMPPTVVTQATPWWETILALVKLQEIGLGVHLPVKVWVILLFSYVLIHKKHNMSLGLAYLIAHTSELNCDIHIYVFYVYISGYVIICSSLCS